MHTLLQDLRHGARTLFKQPGFTFVAVLTLALGIGATATVFSLFYSLLLRPLPYPNADRIVSVGSVNQTDPKPGFNAPADFVDWKRENTTFAGLTAFAYGPLEVKSGERTNAILGASVSEDFFTTFGVAPRVGRTFAPEDFADETGNVPVILSDAAWRKDFGGDPAIVGKTLDLRAGKCTIVGVMPEGFAYPFWARAWMPLARTNGQLGLRGNRYFDVVGRIAEGRTRADAENDLKRVAAALAERHPRENRGWTVQLMSLRERTNGDDRLPLTVLLSAVGLLLAISCANIAALSLVRATARRREIAVKLALGGGGGRLFRGLLIESAWIATMGGVAGLLLARLGVAGLPLLLPESDVVRLEGMVRLDWVVAVVMMLVAQATGIAFGIAPAWRVFRSNLVEDLREGARNTETIGQGRLRQGLVAAQIALAVTLLCGAGLLARSFVNLVRDSPGYDPNGLMLVRVSAPLPFAAPNAQKADFYRRSMAAAASTPGVAAVALTDSSQFGFLNIPANRPDRPFPSGDMNTRYSSVSGNFFRTLGATLAAGREFAATDGDTSPLVFIVNRTAAAKFFPGEDALGRRLSITLLNRRLEGEIVGIANDIRQEAPGRETLPEVYAHFAQIPWFGHFLVVRTSAADPRSVAAALEKNLQRVDPAREPDNPVVVAESIASGVALPRLYLTLLGMFAAAAVGLAAVGIYGVAAYSVARRTHEIGIRMALGARSRDVQALVLKQGGILALIGAGGGLAATFLLSRYLESLLFRVEATDPMTFIGAALTLGLVALSACWIPARRAAKVDPMVALRCE